MLLTFLGTAQDLSFVNYSTKDGLSSSQVYQMFQDKNGDILFATDRGITKYDGYEFQTYDRSDGLTNTTVFKFFPQLDGTIWCSTIDNSWFYFKNGTTNFKAFELNSLVQEASLGGQVEDIWIDTNGDYYFGFEDLPNFLKINSETKTIKHSIDSRPNKIDSLNATFVKTNDWFKYTKINNRPEYDWGSRETVTIKKPLLECGFQKIEFINDHFFFSSANYLSFVDQEASRINLKFDSRILGIGTFDNSHFYVSLVDGGIKIFDMSGIESRHWLKNLSVTALFVDNNKGIWISTINNGVYYAQTDKLALYPELGNEFIYTLSPGLNKEPFLNMWNTMYQYNGTQWNLIPNRSISEYTKATFSKKKQNYYVEIPFEELIKNGDYKSGSMILDYSENSHNPLLVSGAFVILQQTGEQFEHILSKTRITAIEYAQNGYLIGGNNGLKYYRRSDSSFNQIFNKALQGRISDIKLKDGVHFIGTSGEGLIKYNERKDKALQIRKTEGLASNIINEVYAESNSIVWVATNAGLDRVTFNKNEYTIKHFGIEDGLIDNDVTDVYVHNGIIWIGTRSGLCSISKQDIENTTQPSTLNLFWESIYSNDRKIEVFSNLQLAHDENSLELNFHSAFFGGKSRVSYRYKIAESNDIWHTLNGRKIILNGLPPGTYKVILQANLDNTNWRQNQIELNFIVWPPFYQTWLFRTIIGISLIFMIYLFFRFRLLIYNRSLVKEILRLIIRKLKPKTNSFVIQEQGKSHRINSAEVLYLKSEGNYLTIQLADKKYTIRYKIGEYELLVPDKSEYLRVHKSFVARIDNMTGKDSETIYFQNIEIPIGKTYKKKLKEMSI